MGGNRGERTGWEEVEDSAVVQGLSFSLKKPTLQLSDCSIMERTKALNDSHLSAVHVLSFKMSLFPELLAMTRLIVEL